MNILAIDLGKFKSVACLFNTETNEAEFRLCIAAEKKWSLRTNCPTYDNWSGSSQQAKTTQNQAFTVSTVPERVGNGTVQIVKYSIKAIAESFNQ